MTACPTTTPATRNYQGYRYNSMIQSESNGGWPQTQRIADRSSTGHQAANFHLNNDNPSSVGTTYSIRPEGHIYEEVGPPQPPPYFCTHGEMDGRVPSVHQTMDHLMMRASPSSLCSMCSRNCTGHRMSPPTLPQCNCISHGMQQPFCNNHHGSISQHQMHTPMTLHGGHSNPAQQCSPTCTLHSSPIPDTLHHGVPCNMHQQVAVSNQRYTAPTGTITPDLHNSQVEGNGKPKDRSLSPFAFLRKTNRDSKASTNTLDTSSGKSVLMCSRRWIVAIVLTFVLIVVLSVAVGLVVTFTVQDTGKEVTSSKSSDTQSPVVRLTTKLWASVKVITGSNSVYSRALSQRSSQEFRDYTASFTYQTNEVLRKEMSQNVDYTQVDKLSNGSVVVEFIINLKEECDEDKAIRLADAVKLQLYMETNSTKTSSSFRQEFPLALNSIEVKPLFESTDGSKEPIDEVTTIPATTVPPTTELTTTPLATTESYTLPPPSGVCEPITDSICQQIHYNDSGTTYPNFVGHSNQQEATVFIEVLNAIMASTACYDYLNTFSCALLAPKCGEDGTRIPPCRQLCEAAFEKCGPYMDAIMSSQDRPTNCSWFPNSTDPNVCVDEQGPVVPTATPTCPSNFFACRSDNLCTAMKNRCDGANDCADGSDELNCDDFECVPGQFKCNDNDCRPKVWRCNGRVDCDDGSDEESCEPIAPCQLGEFKCFNGYDTWNDKDDVCIEFKFTCDGTYDCSDRSDEDGELCKGVPMEVK